MNTGSYSCLPTLNMNKLTVERVELNVPALSGIAKAILPELLVNFERAHAEVIQCPDLTLPPFNLVSEGLSGDENMFDIGAVVNIIPEIKREKLYDIKDLKRISGSDPLFVVGPCAGPYPYVGVDSECVVNVKMTGDSVENGTHIVTSSTESPAVCTHSKLPDDETRFSLLGNFFTSNGLKGDVLKIVCEIRKGPLNFFECIGEALIKHYGDKTIGLGGVVHIENGKIKVHIFKPELAKTPLKSDKEWLNLVHFIEISPPSVGIGCILSRNPLCFGYLPRFKTGDLSKTYLKSWQRHRVGIKNLRLQHFHLYTESESGEGGHYHYDTEPETIKYTGYFSLAMQLTKID